MWSSWECSPLQITPECLRFTPSAIYAIRRATADMVRAATMPYAYAATLVCRSSSPSRHTLPLSHHWLRHALVGSPGLGMAPRLVITECHHAITSSPPTTVILFVATECTSSSVNSQWAWLAVIGRHHASMATAWLLPMVALGVGSPVESTIPWVTVITGMPSTWGRWVPAHTVTTGEGHVITGAGFHYQPLPHHHVTPSHVTPTAHHQPSHWGHPPTGLVMPAHPTPLLVIIHHHPPPPGSHTSHLGGRPHGSPSTATAECSWGLWAEGRQGNAWPHWGLVTDAHQSFPSPVGMSPPPPPPGPPTIDVCNVALGHQSLSGTAPSLPPPPRHHYYYRHWFPPLLGLRRHHASFISPRLATCCLTTPLLHITAIPSCHWLNTNTLVIP